MSGCTRRQLEKVVDTPTVHLVGEIHVSREFVFYSSQKCDLTRRPLALPVRQIDILALAI